MTAVHATPTLLAVQWSNKKEEASSSAPSKNCFAQILAKVWVGPSSKQF